MARKIKLIGTAPKGLKKKLKGAKGRIKIKIKRLPTGKTFPDRRKSAIVKKKRNKKTGRFMA